MGDTYLIAEIGINHNGDPDIARRLIAEAAKAGADAVKFQVGDPERYVNRDRWDVPRETPWGVLTYIEYRKRLEFDDKTLRKLKADALWHRLDWFASPLDISAVGRLAEIGVPYMKVASPMVTDCELLAAIKATGIRTIMSTGMSTTEEIEEAYRALGPYAVLHCTSAYPCPPEQVNLMAILGLKARYPDAVIGFSDHTVGVPCSVAAVTLGARIIERHLTLSRAMWGSDHAASLEPAGFWKMAKYIRTIEAAKGDGIKRVYDSELANMSKFRLDSGAALAVS